MRRIVALAGCLIASTLFAQDQPTSTPSAPHVEPGSVSDFVSAKPLPDTPSKTKSEDELEKQKLEQSYRVMGVLPMFGTTSRHNAEPLTSGEKFHIFAKSVLDPVTFVTTGFQAGISQAKNSFPEYGQGIAGFSRYYGAAFADSVDSNFFANYFYPVLFKQDPRYFRLGEGSIKRRIGNSFVQEFVARKDSGGRTFHYSNVLGAFTSGAISNAYYPKSARGVGLTMSRGGIALLYGTVGGLFAEFWPDIQSKIFKHKERLGLTLPTDDPPPGKIPGPTTAKE